MAIQQNLSSIPAIRIFPQVISEGSNRASLPDKEAAMLRGAFWALTILAVYDHVVDRGLLVSAAMRLSSSILHFF
jgi:hypothetical protein